jgi:hypothetical protein
MNRLLRNWRLPLQAFAIAVAIVLIRVVLDKAGLERISVSPLVATIITATVFILGFLLTGVLSDYKESEKLPGDLAVSLGVIADECAVLWRHKQAAPARDCLLHVVDLVSSFKRWFCKTERTQVLSEKLSALGDHFFLLEPFTQANFIVRLKQEQTAITRMLTRIHTIRETSFVASGYTMAVIATGLVLIGLLSLKVSPWYESAFLVGVIALFLAYLILLIRDLDDPFDYGEDGTARGEEVSIKPLYDLEKRLAAQLEALGITSGESEQAAPARGEVASPSS